MTPLHNLIPSNYTDRYIDILIQCSHTCSSGGSNMFIHNYKGHKWILFMHVLTRDHIYTWAHTQDKTLNLSDLRAIGNDCKLKLDNVNNIK